MHRYPSVEQFRNVIRNVQSKASFVGKDVDGLAVYDSSRPIPTLPYRGTVKIHGTNASIGFKINTGDMFYQSRSRVLDLQSDNAGFMLYMMSVESYTRSLFLAIMDRKPEVCNAKQIVVYGEWAGQGIQKEVAVSEVPKFFAYFGIKVIVSDEENYWLDVADFADLEYEAARIYNILRFGSWELDVDFKHPQLSQQKFVEITEAVEAECPAGKHLINKYIQNTCTILPNYEIQWVDESITELASYKEIKNNILNYVKENSVPVGSVIELAL